jgi:NADPH-dependent 2,4-dienoyl-CoA reductase/sulfur reductase-like enzyme
MMDLRPHHKCVVIGGGLLGFEAAAGMAARGVDVTVAYHGAFDGTPAGRGGVSVAPRAGGQGDRVKPPIQNSG